MRPEVAKRLLDALEAIRQIRSFTADKTAADFAASRLLQSAVERQFEIVGEALGRAASLDSELDALLPDLRRIVGLRNRLIHGYDSIDDEIIWDVIQSKLLPLMDRLQELLLAAGHRIH